MRFLVCVLAVLALSPGARADNLTLACLDIGRVVDACNDAAARFSKETGHEVRVVKADATGRRALDLYGSLFAVQSPRVDVIQFPESWTAALSADLATLDTPADAPSFLPQLLAGGRFGGRLVGLPQHLAVTLLFYRSDILGDGDPSQWAGLRESLLAAPAEGVSGLAFGGAGPTLFPLFLDWLYSNGADGLEERAPLLTALQAVDQSIGSVTDASMVATTPADAVRSFASGGTAALVTRSTAAAEVRASELSGEISSVIRPGAAEGETPVLAAVWYAGVSRYSEHRESAQALANYLVTRQTQRISAIDYGLAPTLAPLYQDPDVLAAGPVLEKIGSVLPALRLPPVARYGLNYLDLADEVANAVRSMLKGEADPDQTATRILRAARRASRQVD